MGRTSPPSPGTGRPHDAPAGNTDGPECGRRGLLGRNASDRPARALVLRHAQAEFPWCRCAWRKPCDQISTRPLPVPPSPAVPAVLGGKHGSRIARRRDSTGPNAREPRGSGGVPGGGRPPDLARPSLHDTLAAQNKDTSLLPEQPLQRTTLVEHAPSTVSVRDEQATAAARRDWYRADPRAYIRIAAVLRERITAGELVPGRATPSISRLCADHGAWPARPQLTPCGSFRMPGSYTRSQDSATTSAMTSFRSFANRAAGFRTVSQAARKRSLPGLRYARYYLRGVAASRRVIHSSLLYRAKK